MPTPDRINLTVVSTQTVGQPLMLDCSVTIMRGITSRVDIVWSSNGSELKRIEGANASSASNGLEIYTAFYDAMQINTNDDHRAFQCEVFVNTNPPLIADDNITLDVIG